MKKFIFFCEDCKLNICDNCKKEHQNHSLKSFIDIIPNKNKKQYIKNFNKENKEKCAKMIDYIKGIKNEIKERYKNLMHLFLFLKNDINKYIDKYNYSYLDYYNYKNLEYCLEYFENEKFFKKEDCFNYLIFGNSLDDEKSINSSEEININENNSFNNFLNKSFLLKKSPFNNIKLTENKSINTKINYGGLLCFKDNIFLSFNKINITKIDLLEFKIDSFQHILTYNLNKLGKIQSLKPAKYSNDILINFS